jgi:hypothetical protein
MARSRPSPGPSLQGIGVGSRAHEPSNDTDIDDLPLGPDERRRFAAAQQKASLSAARSANEQGGLESGDAVVDVALAKQRTLDHLQRVGKWGGAGARLTLQALWGPAEDAVIVATGSDFNGEPASRAWAAVRLGGSYAVRIGARVVTVTKHSDNFADDAVRAVHRETELGPAERRVNFPNHGGEFVDDSLRMREQPLTSFRPPVSEQPRDALGRFSSKTHTGQRPPGFSAVDDFASKAENNGFDVVGREVVVNTPFGQRRYDVVLRDRMTGAVHGVEVKSTQSAFEKFDEAARQQFAADRWVNRWGAEAVGRFKGLRIEGSSKLLWEQR